MEAERNFVRGEMKLKKVWSRRLFVGSFLALPMIGFLIFYIYVHLDSFCMAFQREGPGGEILWTFDNFKTVYKAFFQGEGIHGRSLGVALRNTCLFYATGLLVNLPLSLLIGYFFSKKIAGYKTFRVITYMPSIIMSTALVMLFKYTFGEGGPYHASVLSGGGEYANPITKTGTAIWMMLLYTVSFGLGGNIVIWGGAMNSISPEVLEAGKIDGCNWFQEFYLLIIPMIWPTISTVVILGAVGFLGASGPVLAFTKGEYNTYTLAYMLYEMIGQVSGSESYQNYYLASALGLCMTAISFPLAMFVKKIVYSDKREEEEAA
ncbi:MAG: carbohydrate ABC transporter permease [Candidatus Scatosoma sp.]